MYSVSEEVENSPRRRRNELERTRNGSSTRSGTSSAPPGLRLGSFESSRWRLSNDISNSQNGPLGIMQRDEMSRWGRRRTWRIPKQRAHLGVREGRQTKQIVEGIPVIQFVAREVEHSPRERPNELEGVETQCPKRCGTTRAPPGSRLGSFESSRWRLSNDVLNSPNEPLGIMQRDEWSRWGGGGHGGSRSNERTCGRERGAKRSGSLTGSQ